MAEFAGRRESGRRVRRTGGAGVVLLVACVAQCAVQRVVVVHVAVGAQARRHDMRSRQLEAGGGVVKRGIGPENGVVTGFASCRERGRNVVHRRGRVVVIRLVARDASGAGQIVIIVDVAIRTGSRRHGVAACEWEPGSAVVKGGVEPGAGGVALVTGLREIRADVTGIRRSLVVLQVAGHAGRAIEAVVVVDVAVGAGAWRHGVQSGEGESGAVVIERGTEPGAGAMALIAGLREVRRHVIGIRRSLIVL